VAKQIFGFVLGGHQDQTALLINGRLQSGAWSKAKGITQLTGDGQLAFGGEGDG
jgi:hypothetical protein